MGQSLELLQACGTREEHNGVASKCQLHHHLHIFHHSFHYISIVCKPNCAIPRATDYSGSSMKFTSTHNIPQSNPSLGAWQPLLLAWPAWPPCPPQPAVAAKRCWAPPTAHSKVLEPRPCTEGWWNRRGQAANPHGNPHGRDDFLQIRRQSDG